MGEMIETILSTPGLNSCRGLVRATLLLLSRLVFKGNPVASSRLKALGVINKLLSVSEKYKRDTELYLLALDCMTGFARTPVYEINAGRQLVDIGFCKIIIDAMCCNCDAAKELHKNRWSHFNYPYVCEVCIKTSFLIYCLLRLEDHRVIEDLEDAGIRRIYRRAPPVKSKIPVAQLSSTEGDLDGNHGNEESKEIERKNKYEHIHVNYKNTAPGMVSNPVDHHEHSFKYGRFINIDVVPGISKDAKDLVMENIFETFNITSN